MQNKQKSIATIVNFHTNEKKKHVRDSVNILKDAEQVAHLRLPILSTFPPHVFKEPLPVIPHPSSMGHGCPQRP